VKRATHGASEESTPQPSAALARACSHGLSRSVFGIKNVITPSLLHGRGRIMKRSKEKNATEEKDDEIREK
jgi:hypothetical protein